MCVCVVLVLIKFRLFLVRPENDITEIDDAPHDVRSFRQILFLISPPKIKIQLIWVRTTPGGEITPVRYATHVTRKNINTRCS